MLGPGGRVVARMDGREPPAVAVDDESGQRLAGARVAGASLEVDQVAGGQRREPPGHKARPRAEREMQALTGFQQEIVEPIERLGSRLGGGREPLPCPVFVEAFIVTNHRQAIALGGPDALAG